MIDLIKKTKDFINDNNLLDNKNKILLGVSGGVDSIVLLDIFHNLKINFAVAHCNFQLRGDDSKKDQEFVNTLAEKYNSKFYTVNFDTKKYAKDNGISIEMAARDLRYYWFEKIRSDNNFDYIAVAHNKNDVAETILLNLVRGTGLKGLTGITAKNNKIIRPLLFASRDDIFNYNTKNNLQFRQDKSNYELVYKRNIIRHKIIPLFNELNPAFIDTMFENSIRLKETYNIYLSSLETNKQNYITKKNDFIYVNYKAILKSNSAKTLLFEYLKPYNFSDSQLNDILKSTNSISGKQFNSKTHKLVKDRDFFIISKLNSDNNKEYFLCKTDKEITEPINIKIEILNIDKNFKLSRKNNIADFDIDVLRFPLKLRKWKNGDFFMPLGMNRAKKLSDFFIDEKISVSEKENTWILESKGEIVWIIGKRIDDRFKVNKATKQILRLSI